MRESEIKKSVRLYKEDKNSFFSQLVKLPNHKAAALASCITLELIGDCASDFNDDLIYFSENGVCRS